MLDVEFYRLYNGIWARDLMPGLCRIFAVIFAIFCHFCRDFLLSLVISPESCCVAMYVTCSEDSERMKQKSLFSTTPLLFDTPSPANPRKYLHKSYTARNYVLCATFLSLTVYG